MNNDETDRLTKQFQIADLAFDYCIGFDLIARYKNNLKAKENDEH